MAASQVPWHLIGLSAVFGVFAGGTIRAANALVANLTAPERRGAIYGAVAAATSVGGFLGPLTGAGVAASFGFRFTFVLTGVVVLLVTAAMVVAMRRADANPEEKATPA